MADENNNQQPQSGVKFDLNPGAQPQPAPQPSAPASAPAAYTPPPADNFAYHPSHRSVFIRIGLAVAIIAVLLAVVYFVVLPNYGQNQSTSSFSTTSIPSSSSGQLSSCGTLSTPGSYTLAASLKQSASQGACINITSSGVSLSCNNFAIQGSGPYNNSMPYSYGILAQGVNNITVTGCDVANFSYGIYLEGVHGLGIMNNTVSFNYISSLFIGSSSSGQVSQNHISYSESPQGAIYLTNGSTAINFMNNTLNYNLEYGININASQHNTFNDNYINGSRFSFACTPESGASGTNIANGNTCYNETGCDFVMCRGIDVPINLSKLTLQSNIGSCGSINTGGQYFLNGNINMRDYTSAPNSSLAIYSASCIDIYANNVNLNCNNYTIENPYIGIHIHDSSNVTLTDCNVENGYYGIIMNNQTETAVNGGRFYNNDIGVELNFAAGDSLTGTQAYNNSEGVYMNSTSTTILKNFSIKYNDVGFYLSNSLGNIFLHGTADNNTKFDIYGASDSQNSLSNLFGTTACGTTNTHWATCALYISNSTSFFFPIGSCTTVKRPGTYQLTQSITNAQPDCIVVDSNNVTIDCLSTVTGIYASPNTPGPAIMISNRKNVTVDGCSMTDYINSVQVENSTDVYLYYLNISVAQQGQSGIILNNVTHSVVSYGYVVNPQVAGISLNEVSNSTISYNNVTVGVGKDTALWMNNSRYNYVINNTGNTNYIGMVLFNNSINNFVQNNYFSASELYDYLCDPSEGALWDGSGGVNFGVTEQGCSWLAAIPYPVTPLPCANYNQSIVVSMVGDAVYGAGAVCFDLTSVPSTINCNGHTILATNGGTFARVVDEPATPGSSGVLLENCYLKGFSSAIASYNSSVQVLNDTIYVNSSLFDSNSSSINITQSKWFTKVQYNTVLTPNIGINFYNTSYGYILNNNVTGAIAYRFTNAYQPTLTSNLAGKSSGIGLLFSGTTQGIIQNNNMGGITDGFLCFGSSTAMGNNTDNGGNECTVNKGCGWMSSSSASCP